MKELLSELNNISQELSLRSLDMVDKLPIQNLIDEMNISISDLSASPERLLLKGFVDRLEEILK